MGTIKKKEYKMKLAIILIIAMLGLTTVSATFCPPKTTNGRCGKDFGTRCAWGYCSQWGWCGMPSAYRTNGQTKYDSNMACELRKCPPVSNNGRCGPSYGRCPWGFCSQWSWCGMQAIYRTNGQTKYNSSQFCLKPVPPKPVVVTPVMAYI